MSSKYDSIQTAKDLILEVSAHGLSLAQEDICRAQDIFGHTAIEDLVALANDIGRDNERGEPDPKGSHYSGRPGTRKEFYQILFNIWHWEQATEFYNKYTLEIPAQIAKLKSTADEFEKMVSAAEQRAKDMEAKTAECYKSFRNVEDLNIEQSHKIKALECEIMRLKAKLYDVLVAKEA